jgi:trehalose 6-phosphate phosphatase
MMGLPDRTESARDPGPPPPLVSAADALFLDFDGTLVTIAERPDAVHADERLKALLTQAREALDGCLVIVTGRALADIDRYLGDAIELAAGLHGAELRGISARAARDGAAEEAIAAARALLRKEADGLLVEDKGLALALHFRQRPELGSKAELLARQIVEASEGALALQPGSMVFEIKPAGVDKGIVVGLFLSEPAFRGRRPVFVGDDLTDEAGFAAAQQAGGHGVLVGPFRPTAASYRLPDIAAVHRWLEELARETA